MGGGNSRNLPPCEQWSSGREDDTIINDNNTVAIQNYNNRTDYTKPRFHFGGGRLVSVREIISPPPPPLDHQQQQQPGSSSNNNTMKMTTTTTTTTTKQNKNLRKLQIDIRPSTATRKNGDFTETIEHSIFIDVKNHPHDLTFQVQLCNPQTDIQYFIPNKGWELEKRTNPSTNMDEYYLTSPYLGKPPDRVQYFKDAADNVPFLDEFGRNSVKRGPIGYLNSYGLRVLDCAIALAFNGELDDYNPPPHVKRIDDWDKKNYTTVVNMLTKYDHLSWVPVPVDITVGSKTESKKTQNEDGHVIHKDEERQLCFMAVFDGHTGASSMKCCVELAQSLFLTKFDEEMKQQPTNNHHHQIRTKAIRVALRSMYTSLENALDELADKIDLQNQTSGAVEYSHLLCSGLVESANERKNKYTLKSNPDEEKTMPPPYERTPGAVSCVCVLDMTQALLHVSTVGDCWCACRRFDTIQQPQQHQPSLNLFPSSSSSSSSIGVGYRVSHIHASGDDWEVARIMLAGGFVDPNSWRAQGCLMPSRCLCDCDLKRLRPEAARALVAEPTLELVQLYEHLDSHIFIATDGFHAFQYKDLNFHDAQTHSYYDPERHDKPMTECEKWFNLLDKDWNDDQTLIVGTLKWSAARKQQDLYQGHSLLGERVADWIASIPPAEPDKQDLGERLAKWVATALATPDTTTTTTTTSAEPDKQDLGERLAKWVTTALATPDTTTTTTTTSANSNIDQQQQQLHQSPQKLTKLG
jgi:serine/threonine protein phosphatase PrpC